MGKPVHHTLDIYGVELHLATDRRAWATLRRRLDFIDRNPNSAGLAHHAMWEPKGAGLPVAHVVLWIDTANHLSDGELIDTCAHEASHAAGQIMDYIGHDSRGTDEPTAYLIGWLTRWVWDHIKQA